MGQNAIMLKKEFHQSMQGIYSIVEQLSKRLEEHQQDVVDLTESREEFSEEAMEEIEALKRSRSQLTQRCKQLTVDKNALQQTLRSITKQNTELERKLDTAVDILATLYAEMGVTKKMMNEKEREL